MTSRPHPRYSIARPNSAARSGGTPSPSTPNAQKPINLPSLPTTKPSSQRLKVVIRRLPPGLTHEEFDSVLGHAWTAANGRVDWAQFRPGKVSRDPSKPSKPGRAYLNLTKEEHLTSLANHIRDSSFVDEKGSMNDAALLGPPTVDFAPYPRIPGGRIRHDARQGTIDQDLEFIEFLESLTNPVAKATPAEAIASPLDSVKTEITVTPLIQFLRDKKANKSKEKEATSPAKSVKEGRSDSKGAKGSQASEKKQAVKTEAATQPEKRSAAALKVERAAREAVSIAKKQVERQTGASPKAAAATPTPAPATNAPASIPSSPATKPPPIQPQPSQAANERRRDRGSASAAARMVQRDLGIGTPLGRRHRDGRQTASADSPKSATTAHDISPVASKPPAAPAALVNLPKSSPSSNNTGIPTGPAAHQSGSANQSRTSKHPIVQAPRSQPQPSPKPHQNQAVPTTAPPSQRPNPPSISPSSTQAFLKHANPSQGITEPLLSTAFSAFGSVLKVEIDKKKGFAYVDFEDNESLKKAIAASPIKVAEGQVVVLERKSGGALQQRNIRGGGPGSVGRGGSTPVSAQPLPIRGGNGPSASVGRGGAVPGGPAMRGRGSRGGRGIGRGGAGHGPGGGNVAGKQAAENTTAPSPLAAMNVGSGVSSEATPSTTH